MGNCKTNTILSRVDSCTMSYSNTFCFTRYLYEKEEVKYALLTSMVTKKEDALFWAYELYYSGWTEELVQLLFIIYYDFYASLNPSFETYLHKKTKLLLNPSEDGNTLIAMIVNSFCIRPSTTDVLFARIFAKDLYIGKNILDNYETTHNFAVVESDICALLESCNYLYLARIIFREIKTLHMRNVFVCIIDYFIHIHSLPLKKEKLLKEFSKKEKETGDLLKHWLFAKVMYFACLEKNVVMGKNLYVHVEPEETVVYETVAVDLKEKGGGSKSPVLPAYQVLRKSMLYSIDDHNYLSLFQLKRDVMNIRQAYLTDWLYYAHFSPLWKKRIQQFRGEVFHENAMIEFPTLDEMESFYENYNYEPDEQPVLIQNKCIQPIKQVRTWGSFYKEQKGRGIIEINEMFLSQLEKIQLF